MPTFRPSVSVLRRAAARRCARLEVKVRRLPRRLKQLLRQPKRRVRSDVMFTAFVLLCAQNYCFAVGGPAYADENECIADFMQNGVPSLQIKYPTYTITQVKCYEWEKQVKS